MGWHVALVNPDQTDLYLGVVEDSQADLVREIAAVEETNRWMKEHPRKGDEFFIVRDDGLLEWYVQEGASADEEAPVTYVGGDPEHIEDLHGLTAPEGVMRGPAYISGAERLGNQRIGGAMDYPGNPPRVVHHTVESGSGSGVFTSMASYLIKVSYEPQVLYDPLSDRLGQFGPLNLSSRALKNEANGRRTNREGLVCIQVEVCGKASSPWTNGWNPAAKPNWQKFIAACRAWGVPDAFPAGALAVTAGSPMARSSTTWHTKGGHYGHCNIPGNDHWDPGAIDKAKVLYKAPHPATDTVTYTVRPGDTLSKIAVLYDTTVANLVQLNSIIHKDDISVGQVLKVPKPKSKIYTVVKGDTLYSVARKFGTTVQKVKEANLLTSDTINVGQVLKIPS